MSFILDFIIKQPIKNIFSRSLNFFQLIQAAGVLNLNKYLQVCGSDIEVISLLRPQVSSTVASLGLAHTDVHQRRWLYGNRRYHLNAHTIPSKSRGGYNFRGMIEKHPETSK